MWLRMVAGGLGLSLAVFALLVSSRDDPETAVPAPRAAEAVRASDLELAASGAAEPRRVVARADGRWVDEHGIEWARLSLYRPVAVRGNPKLKLIRVHRPDGTMEEQAALFRSGPRQQRMPLMRRPPP